MNTLKAEKRTMDTKAKRLRREGYVTGNVFGREMEGSLPVKIEKSAVEKLLKTSNKGSQIMLDVDGQSYDVLIKEIQFNPDMRSCFMYFRIWILSTRFPLSRQEWEQQVTPCLFRIMMRCLIPKEKCFRIL